ncbi:hypothetical protein EHV23_11635 [Lautropia dentalis]|uniref:Uncharacterized protein n=1 Tax=Lautropia dentalis TaxID=2490857 RepID=A0A3R8MQA3_9BURK|nr:Ig-like domain-containing protein [Lautropia dentalis]RRN44027.1 hypothetical protein EHV23_11635 [Lautropia dentalis]
MARLDIQRTHDGSVEHLQLRPGENRVLVRPGQQFRLNRADVDPEQLRVLKVDSDLVIEGIPAKAAGTAAAAAEGAGEGAASEASSIVLEGYYRICSASDRCTVSVDDGTASAEAVASGELGSTGQVLADVSTQPLGALPDGNFVLYDPSFEAPILPMLGDGSAKPLLYGLGGAAVLGLALGGGGGGGGDSGLPPQGNISLTLKSGAYFNTRFPTISGTAQPGSEVQLRIDTDGDQRANVTYTTTSDTSGNWAVNLQTAKPSAGELPATGLADSNTMEVVGMHNGVQSILPQTTMTFDNTPPAEAEISPIADDNIITGGERDKGVTFSGTSEANGSVELKVGTLAPRLVAVGADGKWSATLGKADLPEADGDYTVTVTSLDAAGNRGPEATTKITMNTSGKQAIIGQIAGTDDTVNAAEAGQPIRIAGVAEAGAKLKLSIIDSNKQVTELPGEATADANGAWNADITLPATLTDGQYTLSVTSTNALGNTATGTRAFTVDKTAPNPVANLKVEGGDTIITSQEAKSGVDITGTAEAGAKVTVTVAGGKTQTATAGANGTWKVTLHDTDLPTLGKGQTVPGKLTITAEDKAGNISQPVEQALTLEGAPVDAATPKINTPGALADGWLNADDAKVPMQLSGTAGAGDTVKLSIGGFALPDVKAQANSTWEATVPASVLGRIADGAGKEITASAVTAQGGTSTGASKVTFNVDKTPPTLSSITADDGTDITAEEAANGVTFSGTTEEGSTLSGTWNGKPIPDFQAGPGGTWQFVVNASDMPKPAAGTTANATFSVTATDAAGNKSAAPVSLEVTVHGGVAPLGATTIKGPLTDDNIINSKEDDKISVSGTAQAGANIELRADTVGGKVLGTGKAGANGQWTIDNVGLSDEKLLPDGPHKLVAVATITGNPGTSTVEHTFNIDRVVDLPKVTSFNGHPSDVITDTERKNGIVLAGTGEPNSTLSLRLGDELQAGIPVNGAGNWTSKEFTKIPEASTGRSQPYTYTFTTATDAADNTQTGLGSGKITVQGPTQTATPASPAPNTTTTPAGTRSTTASSLTTDDEGSVANGPDDTGTAAAGTAASGAASAGTAGAGSTTSAGAAATTSPATGSSADNAADATVPGAAGTNSATPDTAADAPASTGPTVAGKSLSGSGTTALAGNHGSSKLSLSDLLDQGSHDMPELQGAPSAGQSAASTAAASSSAAVTSTTAGAGETGSTIVSNPVATVNTLLASQQPWEHQPTV